MIDTVLISGSGQIGSRYLQGLVHYQEPLKIYVYDISQKSLEIAKNRFEDIQLNKNSKNHNVIYITNYENLPKKIEIAIIATTADVRSQEICKILKKCDVKYWILEKVLAQSKKELELISTLTKDSNGAWVNTSRRMQSWHKRIFESLPKSEPLIVRIKGENWGLACNGIHFIDLVAWWTGEKLTEIDTSQLDLKWFKSKRNGFFEITGLITSKFSGGSVLTLESIFEKRPFSFEIYAKGELWKILENEGKAMGPNSILIPGKNKMQSSITNILVEKLLKEGTCDLTALSESLGMHRVFINSLLKHWNISHRSNVEKLPIT